MNEGERKFKEKLEFLSLEYVTLKKASTLLIFHILHHFNLKVVIKLSIHRIVVN